MMSDSTTSPCSALSVVSFGDFRVYWNRPVSVGYDTYFPSNTYGIEVDGTVFTGDTILHNKRQQSDVIQSFSVTSTR